MDGDQAHLAHDGGEAGGEADGEGGGAAEARAQGDLAHHLNIPIIIFSLLEF